MTAKEKYLKELEEEIARKRTHLENHARLFDVAEELAHRFSLAFPGRKTDITYANELFSINCVSVNLRLGENDGIRETVTPIVDVLIDDPAYTYKGDSEYKDMKWKAWDFTREDLPGKPMIKIRAFYEDSNKCRFVDTGKVAPVMELVCDDEVLS